MRSGTWKREFRLQSKERESLPRTGYLKRKFSRQRFTSSLRVPPGARSGFGPLSLSVTAEQLPPAPPTRRISSRARAAAQWNTTTHRMASDPHPIAITTNAASIA